jgi:tetratricopeptide (TPR) repeat protein
VLTAQNRDVDGALKQLDLVLAYWEEHADARLLKGQLLLARHEFAAAAAELERCLQARPNDAAARQLLPLSRKARPDDVATALRIAAVMNDQGLYAPVDILLRPYGKNSNEARQVILKMYREQVEKAWPGKGGSLTITVDGLQLNFSQFGELTDLSPLAGMPLTSLNLAWCRQVGDLTPLAGMPLTSLNLGGCGQVRDLTPLAGLKLDRIELSVPIRFEGMAALREMASLKTVVVHRGTNSQTYSAEEFWKRYDAGEFAK